MRKRMIILVTVAVMLPSGAAVAAIALPDACRSSFHRSSATTCTSDATHIAPSSGVRIPVAASAPDRRMTLRLEIVGFAMLVATGLLWVVLHRRPAEPAPAATLTT
jgi:hypothetical protein